MRFSLNYHVFVLVSGRIPSTFFFPDFEAKCDVKNGKVELNVIVEEASSQADPNLLANTQFDGMQNMASPWLSSHAWAYEETLRAYVKGAELNIYSTTLI